MLRCLLTRFLLVILIATTLCQNTTISSSTTTIDDIESNILFTHESNKLVLVHEIPTNISNVYRGRWRGFTSTANKLSSSSSSMTGEISMKLKSSETILKEYTFVYGEVHLRHGIYIHNRYNHLLLEGVYNVFTHMVYFYLKPPSMIQTQLQGVKTLFNDTGARLAYQLAIQHKSESKRNQDKETALIADAVDPNNNCIYKGVLYVSKLGSRREQEEQFKSFQALSEEEKIRRSIILNMEGELIGLTCNSTIYLSETTFSVETFYDKAVRYSVMANVVTFIQILALIYQMNFTSTQSAAARVSVYMIAQQAMIDSYVTLLHLTVGIFIDGVFDAFTVTTFLSFVLFSIFEMRYLLAVWKANRPDDSVNGWTNMRQELQRLYFRFCMLPT
jgi:hypothetical protein